jgi:excisionase family DNA binding protein
MNRLSPADLIGSGEAAKILGVSRMSLSRWAKDGTLPPAGQLGGGTGAYLFERSAVERLRDERAEPSTGAAS